MPIDQIQTREQRYTSKSSTEKLKFVTIKRIESRFRIADKGNIGGKDILDDANMAIGSFIDRYTNDVFRPLNNTEEINIMPSIIGVSSETPDFYDRCKEYYADMHENVPADGKILNVTTHKRKVKNELGIEIEILIPVAPIDWVIYRHCLEYFKVAKSNSVEDLEAASQAVYYIYDGMVEDGKEYDNTKLKQEALKHLLDLTYGEGTAEKNKETLGFIFRLTKSTHGRSVREIKSSDGKIDVAKLVTIIQLVAETNPDLFINTVNDEHLADRSLLYRAIEVGVINKIGNDIYDLEEFMGDTEEKAILNMNNPNKSGFKSELLSRIKEKEKLIK